MRHLLPACGRVFLFAALLALRLTAAPPPAPPAVKSAQPKDPAPPAQPAEPPEPTAEEWAETREKTFTTVWETVNESYFDATFGGVDWVAVRDKYRLALPKVADKPGLRRFLQAMLGELRRTHFAIMPREAAVFTPAERVRIGTAGVDVVVVGDQIAVSAIRPDSAAGRTGLKRGDIIRQIDNLDLKVLGSYLQQAGHSPARCGFYLEQLASGRLRSAVGSVITLAVQGADGAPRKIELTCEANEDPWSEPMGDFPSMPVECETRREADGLAYLRFNVFARQAMKPIRSLLLALPATGGLVIDLRGNPGGITVMASGISGWLSDHPYSLGTMHLRQGHMGFTVTPQEGAYPGPVAVLIDCASASTSEIMAAGLQEAGRARIFGENSPGAALPSLFKALPTGDLLQYAIADMQTPSGVLIEGRGVIPDEVVGRTLEDLAAGRDPVLDAARRWLETERGKPAKPPAAVHP